MVTEKLTGKKITRSVEQMVHFDVGYPFAEQVTALINDLDLTSTEWQQSALLIILPSLNHIAAVVLAELHGRCGYFSACLRLRPVQGSLPPRYEVAEIINLQEIRDTARTRRLHDG